MFSHDEKKIEEIKDYLKNNLGSSIEEIAEEKNNYYKLEKYLEKNYA